MFDALYTEVNDTSQSIFTTSENHAGASGEPLIDFYNSGISRVPRPALHEQQSYHQRNNTPISYNIHAVRRSQM